MRAILFGLLLLFCSKIEPPYTEMETALRYLCNLKKGAKVIMGPTVIGEVTFIESGPQVLKTVRMRLLTDRLKKIWDSDYIELVFHPQHSFLRIRQEAYGYEPVIKKGFIQSQQPVGGQGEICH